MTNYTTNLVTNPAFQDGLNGCAVITYPATGNNSPLVVPGQPTAVMYLDDTNIIFGRQSLLVQTNGYEGGEGVTLPPVVAPSTGTYSGALYIYGENDQTNLGNSGPGDVIVTMAINGTSVSSSPVTLQLDWQRIVVQNISVTAGQTIQLDVISSNNGAVMYWVSGIQIEEDATIHPYCDGDQPGCYWTGTRGQSTSYQPVANPATGTMAINTSTFIANILNKGFASYVNVSELVEHDYFPVIYVGNAGPTGAVTDFSISLITDPDPAQTYVSWTNYSTVGAPTSGYNRLFTVFVPPKDYIVSNGKYLYHRAAFGSPGWVLPSMTANETVTLARVQVENMLVTNEYSAPAPTSFTTPRVIQSVVEPNRLNFCPNPSIETATTGWTATGSATLSADTTTSVGQLGMYDDIPISAGTHSLKITINAAGDGCFINLPGLLTGFTYMASAYVQAGQGLANINMLINGSETTVLSTGGTGYSFGTYGGGGYGGISPSSTDIAQSTWYRINTTFTAVAGTNSLEIFSVAATDAAYPSAFWVDAVLVEPGEILGSYFDGSTPGDKYQWSGTANLSTSYYYANQGPSSQAVSDALARHVPLGISSATPQYLTPPIG